MSTLPNRKERRAAMKHAGYLKQKQHLPFKERLEVCREITKRGKEIHQENLEALDKEKIEHLEKREEAAMEFWKVEGYNKEEIKMLREAWAIYAVKDKETWHQDKKIARKIMKEATSLRNKRIFT